MLKRTTGENTAMTSIGYPVMSGGKMIGVSGVDISLKSLADKLGSLHPFGSGRVTLLSQTGKLDRRADRPICP